MSGIVLELQSDALDRKVPASSLLRKALLVSSKLGLREIEAWIRSELEGYDGPVDQLPKYRMLRGALKVRNPYHGLIPFMIDDPEMMERITTIPLVQSVGELDALVSENRSGRIQMSFPPAQANLLMSVMEYPLEPLLDVPVTEVVGVLEAVRNKVLQWSLELEARGVRGEGLTFTVREKFEASKLNPSSVINIGTMTNSQIQQGSDGSSIGLMQSHANDVADIVAAIREALSSLQLASEAKSELVSDLDTVDAQLKSPRPKAGVVRESLKSARTILENAAGVSLRVA